VLLRALHSKAAEEVAEALMKIFVDFDPPKILQSDNDLTFLNKAMDEMRSRFGFKNRSTIPYFPQQNGAVERFVGEAKRLVFKTINRNTSVWEKALLLTQRDMNNRILSRHGSKSFDVLFERRLNNLENYRGTPAATTNTLAIEARARDMGEIVFSAIRARAKRDAERKCEDKNREGEKSRKFRVGEWVMKKKDGLVGGVQALWKGLYLVIGKNEESKRY
jgi:transposase InsO family protein